jgi:8-oxo-dGTP diphosphatase
MEHRQAISTVDVVLLTLVQKKLHVVLIKRDKEPYAGKYALPGGYVHPESDADSRAAARRVLEHKTGIKAPYLEQLYTFSGPDRDPRGWSFSVTYYALVAEEVLTASSSEHVMLVPVDKVPELAFDHSEIVEFALKRVQDKSSYSALPCYLLPKEFTLSELQATYEQIMGTTLNKASFRRKLDDLDFLEDLPGKFRGGKQRPAQLYRLRKEKRLTIFDRTM